MTLAIILGAELGHVTFDNLSHFFIHYYANTVVHNVELIVKSQDKPCTEYELAAFLAKTKPKHSPRTPSS